MHRFHGAIQKKILSLLPQAVAEYRFPSIRRVADLVYFPKKIIFEVQCSPISLREVQRRNRDYASLGFTVIWILHDRIYNKKLVSPAELYLRQNLSYYTSMTPFGHGFFYDQLDFFQGIRRVYQSLPQQLKTLCPLHRPQLPFFFPQKLKKRSYYLPGDVTDFLLATKQGKWAWKLEKAFTKRWSLKGIGKEFLHSLLQKHASASHTDRETQSIK